MGRIFDLIHVGKSRLHTLFDTRAKNSFVSDRAAAAGGVVPLRQRHLAETGGKRHRTRKACVADPDVRA